MAWFNGSFNVVAPFFLHIFRKFNEFTNEQFRDTAKNQREFAAAIDAMRGTRMMVRHSTHHSFNILPPEFHLREFSISVLLLRCKGLVELSEEFASLDTLCFFSATIMTTPFSFSPTLHSLREQQNEVSNKGIGSATDPEQTQIALRFTGPAADLGLPRNDKSSQKRFGPTTRVIFSLLASLPEHRAAFSSSNFLVMRRVLTTGCNRVIRCLLHPRCHFSPLASFTSTPISPVSLGPRTALIRPYSSTPPSDESEVLPPFVPPPRKKRFEKLLANNPALSHLASRPTILRRISKGIRLTFHFVFRTTPLTFFKLSDFLLCKLTEFIHRPSIVSTWESHIYASVRKNIRHYLFGFGVFLMDVGRSIRILRRRLSGYTLTRRERKFVLRTVFDCLKIIPMAVLVAIPLVEALIPVLVKSFPGALPSQFVEKRRDENRHSMREERMKAELAKFLQDTVVEMSRDKDEKKRRSEERQKKEEEGTIINLDEHAKFRGFVESLRRGEEGVHIGEISQFAKFFNDAVTLDHLTSPQLLALCAFMDLTAFGNDALLRYQLRNRMRKIKADDMLIHWEGVQSLSTTELVVANKERGMRVGVPRKELESQMAGWLELSLDHEIPIVMLLLSRTFEYSRYEEEKKIQKKSPVTVSATSAEEMEAKAEAAEAAATITLPESESESPTTTVVPPPVSIPVSDLSSEAAVGVEEGEESDIDIESEIETIYSSVEVAEERMHREERRREVVETKKRLKETRLSFEEDDLDLLVTPEVEAEISRIETVIKEVLPETYADEILEEQLESVLESRASDAGIDDEESVLGDDDDGSMVDGREGVEEEEEDDLSVLRRYLLSRINVDEGSVSRERQQFNDLVTEFSNSLVPEGEEAPRKQSRFERKATKFQKKVLEFLKEVDADLDTDDGLAVDEGDDYEAAAGNKYADDDVVSLDELDLDMQMEFPALLVPEDAVLADLDTDELWEIARAASVGEDGSEENDLETLQRQLLVEIEKRMQEGRKKNDLDSDSTSDDDETVVNG